jgi:SAM-dependent methyltransferase
MEDYGPSTYGDRIADRYDEWYGEMFDVESTVTFLASFARGGRALELGIGTGRVALPLIERGIEVHGVEASEKMIEKLRAKPGGDKVQVHLGDFVDPPVEGPFDLVYIPFNTFFALLTQEDQIKCFENIARLLGDEGVFVLDAFVPDMTRFDRNQRFSVDKVGPEEILIEATRHDPASQRSSTYHVAMSENGIRMFPVEIRYAWPSELDLMARLGGMRLQERWGSYKREQFSSDSQSHVSVYERAR